MLNLSYVLITPARNEEGYIEKTIQSVINQTILPQKWVIVSDGSTDHTDDIVKRYEANYDFIHLLCRKEENGRNPSSKVFAFKAGYKLLEEIEYEFIGNLDADITLEPIYYETILSRFKENSTLGIAGGLVFEKHGEKFIKSLHSESWSVFGAVQFFNRKCFENIGGYVPSKVGGIDVVAELMARMQGWKTKTFTDLKVYHHRVMGILENKNKLKSYSVKYRVGKMEYCLGYHPLFEIAKCIIRVWEVPFFIGSFLRFLGYFLAFLQREERVLPEDVIKFLRQEQMQRLFNIFNKK